MDKVCYEICSASVAKHIGGDDASPRWCHLDGLKKKAA